MDSTEGCASRRSGGKRRILQEREQWAMILPQLQQGRLIKRHKRFLADIETENSGDHTIHCPNTGAMTGCAEPGCVVWFSRSENSARKYPYTLELVETPTGLAGVNTGRANCLVAEALEQGRIGQLNGYDQIRREISIPDERGRFDIELSGQAGMVFIEVKSVTLHLGGGVGAFPDAVSNRAMKHLQALVRRVEAGDRGVLVFCAQHSGVEVVRPAREVQPDYAQALEQAISTGLEVLAFGCKTDLFTMVIDRQLPFHLH